MNSQRYLLTKILTIKESWNLTGLKAHLGHTKPRVVVLNVTSLDDYLHAKY